MLSAKQHNSSLQNKVDALIQEAARGPLPAVGFQAYTRDGNPIVSSFAGVLSREEDPPTPVTPDTVVSLASCTKLLTSIAVLQLVDRGLLALDDPVGKFFPQADKLEIIEGYGEDGKAKLRKPTRRMTIRHLLTHSTGLAYSFSSPVVSRWVRENKGAVPGAGPGTASSPVDNLFSVLLFEPGEDFVYGPNIDIAGLIVEAVSNLSLEDFIRENIAAPLHVDQHVSFFNNGFAQAGRLASTYKRAPDGLLTRIPPQLSAKREGIYVCAGGHGLYSTAPAYSQVLLALVNEGVHPKTRARILTAESVALMATPQFDAFTAQKAEAGLSIAGVFANPEAIPGHSWHNFRSVKKNHGLAGAIMGEGWKTGRSVHSLAWIGMSNTNWWIDLEKGVVGFFMAQVFPLGDPHALGLSEQLETAVYDHLAAKDA
ncbi:hypothetical protein PLICRDRAFT_173687 [Plicaturopsis crispa FD-325 SS-3]|nr:hypothetical protein PLICRDRAFT_173687 [Plicaturopsis crispa FD-325 SS-3]